VEYEKTLENLSLVLKDLGDFEKAKDCYQKALEIDKKHYGEYHVDFTTIFGRLSRNLKIFEMIMKKRSSKMF
jgi:tetratricopeptide (TPR) repeat protein